MSEKIETHYMEENTIDLKELWMVLVKRKVMIVVATVLITLIAVVYIVLSKPAKTVYTGTAMVEIGKIVNEQFNDGKYSSLSILSIDNVNNLRTIVSTTMGIETFTPTGTALLGLRYTDYDENLIKNKLQETVLYVQNRHKKMAKLYSSKSAKIKETQLVGDIVIVDTTKKMKKKLIVVVGFITGLMLSVFLAFFLEFIQSAKKDEEHLSID